MALTAKTKREQKAKIKEAADKGLQFSNRTKRLLDQDEKLLLLDPIRKVENWDQKVIEARSRNIAELTWDYLWPWLN